MARDDFSMPTKTALAKRAGYRCSFPGCRVLTIGPSDESTESTANTGIAAHISAASPGQGARRYNPKMTPEERSSIENGIWCCALHAKLIDTDESRFTCEMLTQWKALSEKRAALDQAGQNNHRDRRGELIKVGLAPESLRIDDSTTANEVVGEGVQLACVGDIWGDKVEHAVRDFLVEFVRNALTHGTASRCTVTFRHDGIVVVDDGVPFDIANLKPDGGGGGFMAMRELQRALRVGAVSSIRRGLENLLFVPLVLKAERLPHANPCAIEIGPGAIGKGNPRLTALADCGQVFLVAPPFLAFSDWRGYDNAVQEVLESHSNVTLVMPRTSRAVRDHFQKVFPTVNVLTW